MDSTEREERGMCRGSGMGHDTERVGGGGGKREKGVRGGREGGRE